MPKLYFGSRGGVYYRKNGKKRYLKNNFGDSYYMARRKAIIEEKKVSMFHGLLNHAENEGLFTPIEQKDGTYKLKFTNKDLIENEKDKEYFNKNLTSGKVESEDLSREIDKRISKYVKHKWFGLFFGQEEYEQYPVNKLESYHKEEKYYKILITDKEKDDHDEIDHFMENYIQGTFMDDNYQPPSETELIGAIKQMKKLLNIWILRLNELKDKDLLNQNMIFKYKGEEITIGKIIIFLNKNETKQLINNENIENIEKIDKLVTYIRGIIENYNRKIEELKGLRHLLSFGQEEHEQYPANKLKSYKNKHQEKFQMIPDDTDSYKSDLVTILTSNNDEIKFITYKKLVDDIKEYLNMILSYKPEYFFGGESTLKNFRQTLDYIETNLDTDDPDTDGKIALDIVDNNTNTLSSVVKELTKIIEKYNTPI